MTAAFSTLAAAIATTSEEKMVVTDGLTLAPNRPNAKDWRST
jgi:hypothetical protein